MAIIAHLDLKQK